MRGDRNDEPARRAAGRARRYAARVNERANEPATERATDHHIHGVLEGALAGTSEALAKLRGDATAMEAASSAAARLASTLRAGGKVLVCGNGGSMADAMHFAEELTGRFRKDRRSLSAIACSDPTHITCVANDYGYEHVFSRWVEGLGRRGDCLIVLSTSGNSPNITRAVEAARASELVTIALLGKGGGALKGLCDVQIIVPGATSDRIQELHMLILHAWVEAIEVALGLS
jgi:D-sedoheptulose 7-phosphate isomerase